MRKLIDTHLSANAWITAESYPKMYARSIENPLEFWDEQAREYLHWFKPWQQVREGDLTHPRSVGLWVENSTPVIIVWIDTYLNALCKPPLFGKVMKHSKPGA